MILWFHLDLYHKGQIQEVDLTITQIIHATVIIFKERASHAWSVSVLGGQDLLDL
jgi:hypothetical protein